jgi:hypothetical protein
MTACGYRVAVKRLGMPSGGSPSRSAFADQKPSLIVSVDVGSSACPPTPYAPPSQELGVATASEGDGESRLGGANHGDRHAVFTRGGEKIGAWSTAQELGLRRGDRSWPGTWRARPARFGFARACSRKPSLRFEPPPAAEPSTSGRVAEARGRRARGEEGRQGRGFRRRITLAARPLVLSRADAGSASGLTVRAPARRRSG